MAKATPKNKGTQVLFQNPILERLSRTHIAVPISIFVVYSAVLLYLAFITIQLTWWVTISLFVAGFLLFTLIEYLVHRYVFHMEPTTELKKNMQYKMHGVHHEFPKDKDRLAMPPVLSITLATILLFGFRLIIGDFTFGFLPGVLIGYASYLFVHYIVHAYRPPKNAFKILWVHHGIHHYKEPDRAFGVSSPLWDVIFRTMPR